MSCVSANFSSNVLKKSIPLYASSSTSTIKGTPLLKTLNTIISFKKKLDQEKHIIDGSSPQIIGSDPSDLPAKSPPEVPTAPPTHKPGISPRMPRIFIKEPVFDAIPLEEPLDPKPRRPPAPSPPGQPEVTPPRGPDIFPPQPPEPGEVFPHLGSTIDPPHGPDVLPARPPEPGFPHPPHPDNKPII